MPNATSALSPLVDLSSVSFGYVPNFIIQLRTLGAVILCDRGSLSTFDIYSAIYAAVHSCIVCPALPFSPTASDFFRRFADFPKPAVLLSAINADPDDEGALSEECGGAILCELMDCATEFFFIFCGAYLYTSPDDPTLILLSLAEPEDY